MMARETSPSNRMLKKLISVVLAFNRSSTYPRGYACGLFGGCGLAVELFEHSAEPRLLCYTCGLSKLVCVKTLSQITCVPLRCDFDIPETAGYAGCR
jgi:hypothetical protein